MKKVLSTLFAVGGIDNLYHENGWIVIAYVKERLPSISLPGTQIETDKVYSTKIKGIA